MRRTPGQIFAIPLIVAAVSAVGLLSALIGDDVWDAASWFGLGLPMVLFGLFIVRGGRTKI